MRTHITREGAAKVRAPLILEFPSALGCSLRGASGRRRLGTAPALSPGKFTFPRTGPVRTALLASCGAPTCVVGAGAVYSSEEQR